mgnify:CR=1 FL=1
MGMDIFSRRIKELREEKNLSMRQLAEEIGISHVAISYYESSKREPTLTVLQAYAKYFNVTVDYLIGLSDNRR